MNSLNDAVTAELQCLVGEPITDCWRAANMQIFGFGPRRPQLNRKGESIEAGDICLHIQCRWRFVDSNEILFARDDLGYPADPSIACEDFDWDKQESVLDARQKAWFRSHGENPPRVLNVAGDCYGGFRIELEGGVALECIPCDSRRGEYSEHWRLLGHRADGSHFVVTGDGVEENE